MTRKRRWGRRPSGAPSFWTRDCGLFLCSDVPQLLPRESVFMCSIAYLNQVWRLMAGVAVAYWSERSAREPVWKTKRRGVSGFARETKHADWRRAHLDSRPFSGPAST